MQLPNERDKRLSPMRHSRIDAPPADAKYVVRQRETLPHRPSKRLQRPEILLHDAGIVDDSPVIALCYEAHLSMQKMLAVFAELRGDEAADTIG